MDIINLIGNSIHLNVYRSDKNTLDQLIAFIENASISLEEVFFIEDYKPFLSTLNLEKCYDEKGILVDLNSWIEVRKFGKRAKKYNIFEEFKSNIFSAFNIQMKRKEFKDDNAYEEYYIYLIERGKGCVLKYQFHDNIIDLSKITLQTDRLDNIEFCYGIDSAYKMKMLDTDTLSRSFEVIIK